MSNCCQQRQSQACCCCQSRTFPSSQSCSRGSFRLLYVVPKESAVSGSTAKGFLSGASKTPFKPCECEKSKTDEPVVNEDPPPPSPPPEKVNQPSSQSICPSLCVPVFLPTCPPPCDPCHPPPCQPICVQPLKSCCCEKSKDESRLSFKSREESKQSFKSCCCEKVKEDRRIEKIPEEEPPPPEEQPPQEPPPPQEVCPPPCQPVCLPLCQPVCPPPCQPVCPTPCLPICPPPCQPICPPPCQPICSPPPCQSVCIPLCQSICVSKPQEDNQKNTQQCAHSECSCCDLCCSGKDDGAAFCCDECAKISREFESSRGYERSSMVTSRSVTSRRKKPKSKGGIFKCFAKCCGSSKGKKKRKTKKVKKMKKKESKIDEEDQEFYERSSFDDNYDQRKTSCPCKESQQEKHIEKKRLYCQCR